MLLAIGSGSARAEFTIAASGQARCVILQNASAAAPEQTAARELAEYLHEITGAQFPIQETNGASKNAIIVGPGPLAQAVFPELALDQLGPEEFVMRTRGHQLLLAGGRPRGTLYAVDHFLQEQCGVRWWTPWATNVPRHATLRVPNLDRQEKPAFEYREPFWFSAFDPLWKVRNGANGEHQRIPPELGGSLIYKGFVHTSYPLVPPEEYFASHPEWYSLIDGKRTPDNAQLCLSNPQLRDFVVERVKAWLRESPEATIISVSQNDCFGACQCTNCRAIDDAEGGPSGSMIAFVNYVADRIAPEFPNVAVDTLAYQYTRQPPKTLRPRPNVIVRLCSIECNFRAPLDDASNAKFLADLHDWSKICRRLYLWDYVTDFSDYLLPHPNWYALGPNLRLFKKCAGQGVFEEGAYQSNGAEMAELRAWVLAQLLWNPQKDDHALIQQFLDGYYGRAAARPIRRYLDLMLDASQGCDLACYTHPHEPFLTFKVLTGAERCWQDAEKAAANDPEKLLHVQTGHLPVRFAFLRDWDELRKQCAEKKATWPLPESLHAAAAQFAAVCKKIPGNNGIPGLVLNEGGLTANKFLEQFGQP
ncbi:MAG: DUF4838 domain-containing protein [Verrucomicrobiota bacterium]